MSGAPLVKEGGSDCETTAVEYNSRIPEIYLYVHIIHTYIDGGPWALNVFGNWEIIGNGSGRNIYRAGYYPRDVVVVFHFPVFFWKSTSFIIENCAKFSSDKEKTWYIESWRYFQYSLKYSRPETGGRLTLRPQPKGDDRLFVFIRTIFYTHLFFLTLILYLHGTTFCHDCPRFLRRCLFNTI